MSVRIPSDRSDVLEAGAIATTLSVSTTPVELKVGTSRRTDRQGIYVTNNSSRTGWIGPSGVSVSNGRPLFKDQSEFIPIGDNAAYYIVFQTGTNNVYIEEWA